jgi:hypothetical protein
LIDAQAQARQPLLGRTFFVLSCEIFACMVSLAAYVQFGPVPQTAAKAPTAQEERVAVAAPTPLESPSPALAWTVVSAATAAPPTLIPSPTPATGTWELDLYDPRGVRYQNPDLTACTAAAAQMMLNMAYWADYTPVVEGQPPAASPQNWTPSTTYKRQETILAYERAHMTMWLSYKGADAHGWRNALNYFGWGSTRAGVYDDVEFRSFDDAARATVTAIALYRKPVGILAWAGKHAQLVTGYRVEGEDPRTGSTNFKIVGIYLTDPLQRIGWRDHFVAIELWKSGRKSVRFVAYQETYSLKVDPIDHQRGNDEWDNHWVLIAPVR